MASPWGVIKKKESRKRMARTLVRVNARRSFVLKSSSSGRNRPSILRFLALVWLPVGFLDKFHGSPAVIRVYTYADASIEAGSKPVELLPRASAKTRFNPDRPCDR